MKSPYDVVYTVLITEKGTNLADKYNKYLFKVNPKANKVEIKSAVEAIFSDVKVSSVNVMNVLGKKKRMRGSRMGKRPDWKKAVVTLSEGSIELL
ncbi:MAG: 50S ribosomal protein L23 [Lentisphaerae bacterium]|jgi:large subunit ribosomal protein L23|nr:50S ribosomal protein L23 [Lentisphaerota bacterium]